MKQKLETTLGIKVDYTDIAKDLFCISIASKPYTYTDINKIFNKNKLEYMNYFKNSNVFNSELDKTLLADIALYKDKILGILEKAIHTKDYSDILSLYKKSHKKIYNGIKSLKSVSFNDIAKNTSDGINGNYEFIATVYIYNLTKEKNIVDYNTIDFMKRILDESLILAYYDKISFAKNIIDNYAKELKELRDYFGLEKTSYTGEELIQALLDKDTERYNISKSLTPWEMIQKTEEDMFKIEKVGSVGKYIGANEGLFKFLKINSAEVLKSVTFTPRDINSMLLNYIFSCTFNTFEERDRNSFLVSVIYFTALGRVYNKLKGQYLKTVNEDFLEEIDKLQKNLEKSTYEAKRAKESFEKKEAHFKNTEKELLARIKQLETENKKLKKEVDERESLKSEVIKLRNLVFDESLIDTTDDVELIEGEFDLDKLNNKNVIIFGGNESWVKNMKEKLPEATFAGVEFRNTKLSFVKKDSKVFINTKMSHAFYYKIREVLSKTNSDYYYINASSNINNSLVYMKEQLIND